MLFFFRFLNSVDVIELGGFDELSGKGYELCLFLFSDVLEISKKKSASKGLGLRSPSTMSLRTMGASTLTNNGKSMLKFIYSEKATKFCEIFPILLTVCTLVKSKGKISQNSVAFSEYMNFISSR